MFISKLKRNKNIACIYTYFNAAYCTHYFKNKVGRVVVFIVYRTKHYLQNQGWNQDYFCFNVALKLHVWRGQTAPNIRTCIIIPDVVLLIIACVIIVFEPNFFSSKGTDMETKDEITNPPLTTNTIVSTHEQNYFMLRQICFSLSPVIFQLSSRYNFCIWYTRHGTMRNVLISKNVTRIELWGKGIKHIVHSKGY